MPERTPGGSTEPLNSPLDPELNQTSVLSFEPHQDQDVLHVRMYAVSLNDTIEDYREYEATGSETRPEIPIFETWVEFYKKYQLSSIDPL
jgi:hypothetical protein